MEVLTAMRVAGSHQTVGIGGDAFPPAATAVRKRLSW
jgi:hypothetical protein